ncbi:MAG: hypothetical protein A3K03_07285 [Bdellovibrionales bacterium RIFOXYD1_FULL_44_7]|nr:MAG: hypothetical protein A3K03_07285 [Bdellovibrionales bacterium RIFOXYD1_FULL_44_7]
MRLSTDENELVTATIKKEVCENLLTLLTRDCKFSDFCRELILIAMRAVRSEAGSVLEVDQKDGQLFFRSAVGQSTDRLGDFKIPVGQGIAGHVAESKETMVVNNVKDAQIHLKAISSTVAFEVKSLIAAPIVIRSKIFGVIELLNRIGSDGYSEADIELMNYISQSIAKTIEVRLVLAWILKAKEEGRKVA